MATPWRRAMGPRWFCLMEVIFVVQKGELSWVLIFSRFASLCLSQICWRISIYTLMQRFCLDFGGKPWISLVGSMVAGDIFHDTCVGNCVFVTWIWISIILMTHAFYTFTCLTPPRSLAKLYIIFHQPIDFPERKKILFLSYHLGEIGRVRSLWFGQISPCFLED